MNETMERAGSHTVKKDNITFVGENGSSKNIEFNENFISAWAIEVSVECKK